MTRTATLAQCQHAYDNRTDPRIDRDELAEKWEVAEGIAHDEIVAALTAGKSIDILANGQPYKVDASDVCELLRPETMLQVADLIRSGDEIQASRVFRFEWARAIQECAEKNAEFRAEWSASE